MALVLANIKNLLESIRENDWYITAFDFQFNGHDYLVVFEDLRELDRGIKYYAVMLTFIDRDDENRILRTYANSYDFKASDEDIRDYFYMNGNGYGNGIWNLYDRFNNQMPDHYIPLTNQYRNTVLNIIDEREHNEGFCCYNARHNGKNANGEQINRSGKNTAKTRLLGENLFNILGNDKTISFCYRQNDELSDAEIIANFARNNKNDKSSD